MMPGETSTAFAEVVEIVALRGEMA